MATNPQVKYRINIRYQEQRSRYYAEDLGNGVLLKMVQIPAGTFVMGSPDEEAERLESDKDLFTLFTNIYWSPDEEAERLESEGPQHEVTLGEFFMGMYAVTQAQWRAVAALPRVNRKLAPNPSVFEGENRPVEQVSWYDAVEFCARLSAKTGREYGLPTEAEWEYACRAMPSPPAPLPAGEGSVYPPFHFGETITTDLANYNGTHTYNGGPKGIDRGETTEVGRFPANAFGLYDMHGNVWEWCADHWHDSYADKPEGLKANGNLPWLSKDEDAYRLLRGGSWIFIPRYCRSAFRNLFPPGTRIDVLGFRVVCRAARTLQ